MKRALIVLLLVSLLVLPLVSADILMPGKFMSYSSKITNINDFPEYTFFTIGIYPSSGGIDSMCPVQLIGGAGYIPPYYKFCTLSVYATKKADFNESYLNPEMNINQTSELAGYLSSSKVKEVIKNIGASGTGTVPFWDTRTDVINYYQIDLNNVKTAPDKIVTERNYLPILGPFIITFLLELGVIFLFIRKYSWKTALYVFLINLITWPIANLAFPSFIEQFSIYSILIIEAGVILVESVPLMLLLKVKYPKALLISFVANVASALVGLLINPLLGLSILSP
jgi:hypothetical protein